MIGKGTIEHGRVRIHQQFCWIKPQAVIGCINTVCPVAIPCAGFYAVYKQAVNIVIAAFHRQAGDFLVAGFVKQAQFKFRCILRADREFDAIVEKLGSPMQSTAGVGESGVICHWKIFPELFLHGFDRKVSTGAHGYGTAHLTVRCLLLSGDNGWLGTAGMGLDAGNGICHGNQVGQSFLRVNGVTGRISLVTFDIKAQRCTRCAGAGQTQHNA